MNNSNPLFFSLKSFALIFSLCLLTVFSDHTDAFENNTSPNAFVSEAASQTPRIVGGEEAQEGAWPWAAALVGSGQDPYFGQFCGGTLIDDQWVVTAAHCTEGLSAGDIEVILDIHNLKEEDGTRYTVDEIINHENYDPMTYDSDIALLHLSQPSSQETLDLIPAGDPAGLASAGTDATIIGWGSTDPMGTRYPDALRQAVVEIVSDTEAESIYEPDFDFTDNMLAAGVTGGGVDSCSGDSGGPLMVTDGTGQNWLLAGITSWGIGCALPGYPGVYADVSQLSSWVTSQIGTSGDEETLAAYMPSITSGFSDWTDYLQVDNSSPSQKSFTIVLYSDGEVVYESSETVGGYDHRLIELKQLDETCDTGKVTFSSDALTFRLAYRNTGGGVSEFAMADTLYSTIGLFFSDFDPAIAHKGAAVANMSGSSASVTLYAVGSGSVLGSYATTISPYGKISELYGTWFPSVASSDIDSIVATSSSASLCGFVISASQDISYLLYNPAIPLSGFDPGME